LKEIIRHGDGSFSGFIHAKVGSSFFNQFDGADLAPAAASGNGLIATPTALNQ
jgi:hypothetical protein